MISGPEALSGLEPLGSVCHRGWVPALWVRLLHRFPIIFLYGPRLLVTKSMSVIRILRQLEGGSTGLEW